MPLARQHSVSEEERVRALGQVATEGAFASACRITHIPKAAFAD